MSVWSTSIGKPQLSYADRLRQAARLSTLSAATEPSSAVSGESSLNSNPIQSVNSPSSAATSQPENQNSSSQVKTMSVAQQSNADVNASTSPPSLETVAQSQTATSEKQEPEPPTVGQDQANLATAAETNPKTSGPPAVNVWEARKKQLAEKERERQLLQAQKKSHSASSAPSGNEKPAKSSSNSTSNHSNKSRQSKDASAANSSNGPKGKSERNQKPSSNANLSGDKKTAKTSAQTPPSTSKPVQDKPASLSSSMKSTTAARSDTTLPAPSSAPKGETIAKAKVAKSATMEIHESVSASSNIAVSAQSSRTNDTPSTELPPRSTADPNTDIQPIKVATQKQDLFADDNNLVTASSPSLSLTNNPTQVLDVNPAQVSAANPSHPIQVCNASSEASYQDLIPKPLNQHPLGSAYPTFPAQDVSGFAPTHPTSIAAAIENAIKANSMDLTRPEEDDAWLARIHLLNGGQNMPKFGGLGHDGTRVGIAGGLQLHADPEEEAIAAKKAEIAVAAAWGAGRNVWQKSMQQQQMPQQVPQQIPQIPQQKDVAVSPSSTYQLALSATDTDGNEKINESAAEQIVLSSPVSSHQAAGQKSSQKPKTARSANGEPSAAPIETDASKDKASCASKDQQTQKRSIRKSSNASKGRRPSTSAAKGDTTKPRAPSPPPLGDLNSWPSPLDAGKKEVDKGKARQAESDIAAIENQAISTTKAQNTDIYKTLGDLRVKVAPVTSPHSAMGPVSFKKGKQWIPIVPNITHSKPLPANIKKTSQDGKGNKHSQTIKAKGEGSRATSQSAGQDSKKLLQADQGSSSKAAKESFQLSTSSAVHSAVAKNSDSSSTRALPNKAQVGAATQQVKAQGSNDQGSTKGANEKQDGRLNAAKSLGSIASGKDHSPTLAALPTPSVSRRINGIIIGESTTSSTANSAAGSPRPRPSHLPATPPPPTSFPPMMESPVAQPISSPYAPFAQNAPTTSFSSPAMWQTSANVASIINKQRWNKDGPFSPTGAPDNANLVATASSPQNTPTAVTPSGFVPGNASSENWRSGGPVSKRGRGGRVPTRGGRGGVRGSVADTFTHQMPSSRDRKATGTSASPNIPRTTPTAGQYVMYPSFVPYVADPSMDPNHFIAPEAAADSVQPGVLGMAMYVPHSGPAMFYPQQQPTSAQWMPYMSYSQQGNDLFRSTAMLEATSQTGVPVPPGSTEQLLSQIEFYFSQRNLQGDFFLRQRMDSQGWVDIAVVAGFNRVQRITNDVYQVRDTLLYSAVLDVDAKRMKVRKRFGWETYVLPEDWKASEVAAHHASPNVADVGTPSSNGPTLHHQIQSAYHVDVATSATPSKDSTAMSSPPSSFTKASQDGGDLDDERAVEFSHNLKPSSLTHGSFQTQTEDDDDEALGVVAASGLGGTLESCLTATQTQTGA